MSHREYIVGRAVPEMRPASPTPAPPSSVKDERTEAIRENTKALLELAQAIREHAYLTAPDEEDDDENTRAVYMDGTPVQ